MEKEEWFVEVGHEARATRANTGDGRRRNKERTCTADGESSAGCAEALFHGESREKAILHHS